MPERPHRPGLSTLLVASSAALAYLLVWRAGFVFDDRAQILRNPSLMHWGTAWRAFGWSVWQFLGGTPVGLYYRPLFNALLVVQFHLFGLQPMGWHACSLALHVIAALLLRWLGLAWGLPPRAALAAALLFAVHPVHVESVAWISASPDLLAAVFLMLAAIAWERSRLESSGRLLALAVLCFAAACASKENALAFPLFVALREACAPAAARLSRHQLLAGLTAFGGVACVVLGARLLVLRSLSSIDARSARFSSAQELMTVPQALLTYGRLLVAPWELKIRYAVEFVERPTVSGFLLPLLLVLVGLAGMLLWARRQPVAAIGLAWTLCFLAPVLHLRSFNPLESLVHDRYLYVPSIGFAIAVGAVFARLSEQPARRRVAEIVLGLVVVSGALLTVRQTRVWQGEESFVRWALNGAPDSPFFENYAGAFHTLAGDLSAAEVHYCRAVDLLPGYVDPLMNLREILRRQNRLDEAEEAGRRARGVPPASQAGLCARSIGRGLGGVVP